MTVMVALPNRDVKIERIAKVKPHIVNFQQEKRIFLRYRPFLCCLVMYDCKGSQKSPQRPPMEWQKSGCLQKPHQFTAVFENETLKTVFMWDSHCGRGWKRER